MRGHQALIAMRRAGAIPDAVWLGTDAALDPRCTDWLDTTPRHAQLQLDADESPLRADLRCVVGLLVCVTGSDLQRVRQTRDACIAAMASRVIATTTRSVGNDEFPAFQVVEITDTDGHMTHETEECYG